MLYRLTARWVDRITLADGRTIAIGGLELGRIQSRHTAYAMAAAIAKNLKCRVEVAAIEKEPTQ
jgi:hypothetical protein